jgi:aspartyl-tRNA(Asn)/glutamyl-tRNA(Gln) amidotransferase subunit A
MVIPNFVRQALAGRPITVFGDGTQTRCFCHVADVANALRELMEHPESAGEVFNVGSDEEVSIRGLAERVKALVVAWCEAGDDLLLGHAGQLAKALRVRQEIELPEPHRARAAAMVITAAEGANLHLADLKSRAKDFDPTTRDRFLAGALLPASHYAQAQRFRAWYRARVAEIFREVDVILAPTTPWVAPLIGAPRLATVDGAEVVARAHSGVFTQPLSFIGLPVISVPVRVPGPLPLGVQLIAAPFREPVLFRVAARLEAEGIVAAPLA